MKKSELAIEHQEKIAYVVKHGLDESNWEPIKLLSGGLTGVPVCQISVLDKFYVIKLEDTNDGNFDLVRNYKIVETVSKQGICPKVYFTDANQGILLMQYIEAKRPEASPAIIEKFASVIRNLHDKNNFEKWKSVLEIFDKIFINVPSEYKQKNIIKKCMAEIKRIEPVLFDPDDIRSCHCDLNPANVLFNGNEYFLVDWQAASPQSLYFDLACVATWFYFYSEELCNLFVNFYFDRETTAKEKAKYYLMRVFTHIYYGIAFISLPLKINLDFPVL